MKQVFATWIKRVYWSNWNGRLYQPEDMEKAFNAGWRAAIKEMQK